GDQMDVIRAPGLETVKVESGEQRELLQEDGSLAPGAALVDRPAPVVEGDGALDPAGIRLDIVAPEESAMRAGVSRDHVGDLSPIEGIDRGRDPILAPVPAGPLLGRDQAPEGTPEIRILQQLADFRQASAREVDGTRGGPDVPEDGAHPVSEKSP